MERTAIEALPEEQRKAALLHEIVHVFLINRGASANQLWGTVGRAMISGPGAARQECEKVMRKYLRAQEELFVYSQVGGLYSGFTEQKAKYEEYVAAVDVFLDSISARADQAKAIKLDVEEKVGAKRVDWQVSYKYPKSIAVQDSHIDRLKALASRDIGT
jgi:hypothetical protein